MSRILMKLLLAVAIIVPFFQSAQGQSNCIPTNINRSVINLACNQTCTNLAFQIPHLKSSNDYNVVSTAYNPFAWTTPTGNEITSIYSDDKFSSLISLPFTFCFYGANYNSVVVGSNGIITFDASTATQNNAYPITQQIPYAGGTPNVISPAYYPPASIMAGYSDLYPVASACPPDRKIEWRVEGVAPCRKFVASYYHIGTFGGGNYSASGTNCNSLNPNNIQISIHESTGIIDIYIGNKVCFPTSSGPNAILGVQNWQRDLAVAAPGKNATQWSESNTGYRFVPSAGASRYVNSRLYTMADVLVATADTATTTAGLLDLSFPNFCPPAGSTQYKVVTTFSACDNPATTLITTDTITVNRTNSLNATASSTNSTCGPPSGTITVNVPAGSGTAPYTYVLDGIITQVGNSPMTFNNVGPGNHTVVVTDQSGGCTSTVNVTVNQVGSVMANVVPTSTACPGVNNGVITISPVNGLAPYTFVLNPGAVSQTGTTGVFTGLAAGVYTISITDAGGCVTSAPISVTVNVGSGLFANATASGTSCTGATNGTATITPTNGSGPYTFVLDGTVTQTGATSTTFNNLSAGSHSVVVTDAFGCSSSPIAINITAGPALTTTATHTDALCSGVANGTITVTQPATGVAPFEYSLDGVTWQTSNVFNNLAAGTYTVRYRESGGCQGQLTETIGQPTGLTAATNGAPVVCNGQSNGVITVTATGGTAPYQYSINGGANWQSSNIFNVAAGTYTITIRDANLCLTTQTITITQPAALAATGTTTNATCNGGNDGVITITASGGNSSYQYSLDGTTFQGGNSFNVAPGTYTVTIRDNQGCTTTVSNLVVGLTNDLTFTPPTAPTICEGTSTQLQITSNALQYAWTPATGLSNPSVANPVANPTATTTYSVLLTYGRCTATVPVTINVNAAPVPNAGGDGFICYGQTYQLQASGGTEFSWSPVTYLDNPSISNPVSTPDKTITYSVSVKDANGCSSLVTDQVTVDVTPPIKVSTFPFDTVAYSGDQFQILATSGATDYVWSPAIGLSDPYVANPTVTTGAVGDVTVYKVTASTIAGCKGEGYVTVKVYKGPDLYVPTGFTPNGDGKNDKFFPFPVGIKEIKSFKVFNRWGQMVYFTKRLNDGWDGTYYGKEQASGVYVWIVEGITKDNKLITKKGTIALIR